MNKKRLIILVSVIILFVIGISLFIGINKYLSNKKIQADKESAILASREFADAWFNYTKQTDKDYLEKIKPLMTEGFYNATSYVNKQRPQDFEGQIPMSSTVLSAKISSYSDTDSTVDVSLETKEKGMAKNNMTITVTLIKVNNIWLVSDFE